MDDADRHTHPRSTAKIAGHPIHPMLVPFPIVCFIGTFVADLVYTSNGEAGWATASEWLLGIGLGTAALAALAGLTDYFGNPRVRAIGDATKHMVANVLAVVIEAVNLFLRHGHPEKIGSIGLYLSGLVILILLYSGWKGGELVFRYGVGVSDDPSVR
jgi:uncharacterized membrane protein